MKISKIVFASLILIFFNSCGIGGKVEAPDIVVTNILFQNVTLFETTALVDLRLDNENNFPLEVSGSSHRLYLNGKYVGKALDDTGFLVPALSTTQTQVRVQLSNLSILQNLPSMVESDALEYRLESTLHGKGFLGKRLKATKSGRVSVTRAR